jgi:hypothetical protein
VRAPGEELKSEVRAVGALAVQQVTIDTRLQTVVDEVEFRGEMRAVRGALTTYPQQMAVIQELLPKSATAPSLPPVTLHAKGESDWVAIAQSLSIERPLVPYPKWRFDADWLKPDLAFSIRHQVWQYSGNGTSKCRLW